MPPICGELLTDLQHTLFHMRCPELRWLNGPLPTLLLADKGKTATEILQGLVVWGNLEHERSRIGQVV
jgi:hypothetical protein